VTWTGHSIECRITAEDPDNGFKPSVGKITGLTIPGGLGVRVDTHVYAGYDVPPYYDPLLAKLIVWGSDRSEAINRMIRCLDEFEITGIRTNIDFHKKIMGNAYFRKGDLSTNFLRRRMLNPIG
jgi:biotin carboxylase